MQTPFLILFVVFMGCSPGGTPSPPSRPAPRQTKSAETPSTAELPVPQADPAQPPVPAPSDDFVLLYDRPITDADLRERTLRELSLIRNAPFAKRGHPFRKPWLDQFFRTQPWYEPASPVDVSQLSELERANVGVVTHYDLHIDRADLLGRRQQIQSRAGTPNELPTDAVEGGIIATRLGEAPRGSTTRNPLENPALLDAQLTVEQLAELSRRDLRLLRNTIYARRGRTFRSELLGSYFANVEWYSPVDDYSNAMLTRLDQRNIRLIHSVEDSLGGALTEWEHQSEDGWLSGA